MYNLGALKQAISRLEGFTAGSPPGTRPRFASDRNAMKKLALGIALAAPFA